MEISQKNRPQQVQAKEKRDLGVARLKRGDRVTDPKSQNMNSSQIPKKDEESKPQKDGALAHRLKLS